MDRSVSVGWGLKFGFSLQIENVFLFFFIQKVAAVAGEDALESDSYLFDSVFFKVDMVIYGR